MRLKKAAEISCIRRNVRSTLDGGAHRNSQWMPTINPMPAAIPMIGDRKMKMIVLVQPATRIAPNPDFATAAPA